MDKKNITVSVVIPNYNNDKLIAKNLPKILSAKVNTKNKIKEIIIVDDSSTDGSIGLIKSKFPEIKLIKHTKNRGFSAAANTGARSAKGELILLLNIDILVEDDFLAPVLKHFDDKKTFAVSLNKKDEGQVKGAFSEGYIQLTTKLESPEPHLDFYVSREGGVLRRDLWVSLGGMDEKLFSPFSWEDVDICYRAAKRGYQNLHEPGSIVIHNHGSGVSKFSKSYTQKIYERNELLMIWKNIHSSNLIRKHFVGVFMRVIKNPGYITVVVAALGRIGTLLKARRREIKESRVSDEAVFSKFTN